jgi:hypothetical protein
VRTHRFALLFATLGCLTLAAVAPAAGCNGTGTTPMCDFPDGANNPESGCGVLVEAAAPVDAPADGPADAVADTVAPIDSPVDSSDATAPDAADAHVHDAAADSADAHIQDARSDAKG